MALKLLSVFKGVPANYWKILSISENILGKKTTVELGLYINHLARKASDSNILNRKIVQLDGVDLTRVQIYDAIKKIPFFAKATDC